MLLGNGSTVVITTIRLHTNWEVGLGFRVGHGLDSSMNWIGLDWIGLDWSGSNSRKNVLFGLD
jgi:hypothetical protein